MHLWKDFILSLYCTRDEKHFWMLVLTWRNRNGNVPIFMVYQQNLPAILHIHVLVLLMMKERVLKEQGFFSLGKIFALIFKKRCNYEQPCWFQSIWVPFTGNVCLAIFCLFSKIPQSFSAELVSIPQPWVMEQLCDSSCHLPSWFCCLFFLAVDRECHVKNVFDKSF